jgi:hypothetical protein
MRDIHISMNSIKAIQTRYKGFNFRSRLEARWAVFFDNLGAKWEYEKDTYDLGKEFGGYYLPDFWLPFVSMRGDKNDGVFVEIKGPSPTEIELRKCSMLSSITKKPVVLFVGVPIQQTKDNIKMDINSGYQFDPQPDYYEGFYYDTNMSFFQCERCGHIKIEYWEGNYEICPRCNNGCNDKSCFKGNVNKLGNCNDRTSRLRKAYNAARSARFDHGESGAT